MRILVGKRSVLFFFLLLFALPAATRADEIVITDGSLHRPGPSPSGPTFSLASPAQGFAISNVGYDRGDGGGGWAICFPCVAGQSIPLGGQFSGFETLGFGPASVGGVNYERVHYSGSLVFTSPNFIVPSDNSPLVTITVPFTMTGDISLWLDMNQPPPFFTTAISGQGTATVVLSSYFTETSGWLHEFRGVTYNFSPAAPEAVPEPATLILFGTGLAAMTARYRRRRHSTDQPEG